jgi:hypothetical protein
MRKRQTFLLTIMTPENGDASFCGRIKIISSGETQTFTSLEELNQMVASAMEDEMIHQHSAIEKKQKNI